MQATIALFVARFILRFLRKHPTVVRKLVDEAADRIPGKVDDFVLHMLADLLTD